MHTGGRVDDGDRSIFTDFSANRTGGLGNQEPLIHATVRQPATATRGSRSWWIECLCCIAVTGGDSADGAVLSTAVSPGCVQGSRHENPAVAA